MFDFQSALKAAKSGDTIVVPPGEYESYTVRRVAGLTIDGKGAKFRSLVFSECVDLKLVNIEVVFVPDEKSISSTSALRISSSQGVEISAFKITGGVAIAGSSPDVLPTDPRPGDAIIGLPIGRGMTVENSTDVKVLSGSISKFHKGIVLANVKGLVIKQNDLSDFRTSPIVGGNVSHAEISENKLSCSRPWKFGGNGDHGDFIHLWTVEGKQTGPSDKIVIKNNLIDQAEGDAILGIYLDDNNKGLGFSNVVIEGNIILNGNAQGVALERVQGVVSENLLLQTSGTAKQGPSILLRAGCNVNVNKNVLPDTYGTIAKKAAGGTYSENVLLPLAIAKSEDLSDSRKTWNALYRSVAPQPEPEPTLRVIQVKAGERIIIEGV